MDGHSSETIKRSYKIGGGITEKNNIEWINVGKGIAIIAVLVNHTYGILYHNYNICLGSYFSVSLFIFLAGITNFLSSKRHSDDTILMLTKYRVKRIIMPYVAASFIYYALIADYFSVREYLSYLLHFNASDPLYFVALYLQLLLVAPFLAGAIKKIVNYKRPWIWYTVIFMLLLAFSAWSNQYTNILDIRLGGGKLLGGTYLCLFYFQA